MRFVGYFSYNAEKKSSAAYGQFHIIADAPDAAAAQEIFRKRVRQMCRHHPELSGDARIYLESLAELPDSLDDGIIINHHYTCAAQPVEQFELNVLPEIDAGNGHVHHKAVEYVDPRAVSKPFLSLGGAAENAPDRQYAPSGNSSAIEYHLEQHAHLDAHLEGIDDLENWAGIWYVVWPDGRVSIAMAAGIEQAMQLFERAGQVCREMIKPWKGAEMMLDFQFDSSRGDWVARRPRQDAARRDLISNVAPQIDYVITQLYRMDRSEFEAPRMSDAGQKVLREAFSEYLEGNREDLRMISAVHRARCEDPFCLFCLAMRRSDGEDEAAGIA